MRARSLGLDACDELSRMAPIAPKDLLAMHKERVGTQTANANTIPIRLSKNSSRKILGQSVIVKRPYFFYNIPGYHLFRHYLPREPAPLFMVK